MTVLGIMKRLSDLQDDAAIEPSGEMHVNRSGRKAVKYRIRCVGGGVPTHLGENAEHSASPRRDRVELLSPGQERSPFSYSAPDHTLEAECSARQNIVNSRGEIMPNIHKFKEFYLPETSEIVERADDPQIPRLPRVSER